MRMPTGSTTKYETGLQYQQFRDDFRVDLSIINPENRANVGNHDFYVRLKEKIEKPFNYCRDL